MKYSILIITGIRADYGLLKPVMGAMQKSRKLKPAFLVTGVHTLRKFGHTVDEVKRDRFPIVAVVPIREQDSMVESLAREISGIADYLKTHRPDLVVVLGDRDEMFAAAIAAGHLGIPVAHIRGGELTGFVVDEYIRHAITKFSHLHFVTNESARRRVIQLGEEPRRVFNVGATEFDGLAAIRFPKKAELARRLGLPPDHKWFLVVHHPTPLDPVPPRDQIRPLLEVLASRRDIEKIVIYSNADTGSEIFIREIERYRRRSDFHLFKNFVREEYLSILRLSDLMIGNSSSGIVDVAYFRTPTIQVGDRQKGRDRGVNVLSSRYDRASIVKAMRQAESPAFQKMCRRVKNPYGQGNAAAKITKVIERYIANPNLVRKLFHDVAIPKS